MGTSGISSCFPLLSRSSGQVAHVLLTRSPLDLHRCCHRLDLVRLACVKHAASVRPEPGSNSPSRSSNHPRKDGPKIRESVEIWRSLPTGTRRICCPSNALYEVDIIDTHTAAPRCPH